MARKHNEDEVLYLLRRKHDIKIKDNTKEIQILSGKSKKQHKSNDLGNGSWGKIDFLINHCGYRKYIVDEF